MTEAGISRTKTNAHQSLQVRVVTLPPFSFPDNPKTSTAFVFYGIDGLLAMVNRL